MNQLEQLKRYSVVVVDTGDIRSIQQYQPQDATTNPSLILKAAHQPEYQTLLQQARQFALQRGYTETEILSLALDEVAVLFGVEILRLIPGRVSTEVDARLSFDITRTISKARHLIRRFKAHGVERDRVLIKIAATWEGIQAARILEREGIHCNLTLVFHFAQAVAAAVAGAFLISPFVGRILDWYTAHYGQTYTAAEDPGVQSVQQIYRYFKAQGFSTIVMAASFRNTDQIRALAGCDYLTISPTLLSALQVDQNEMVRVLLSEARADKNDGNFQAEARSRSPLSAIPQLILGETYPSMDEARFRYALNQDPMTTEKLAEGIRLFSRDTEQLEALLGIGKTIKKECYAD